MFFSSSNFPLILYIVDLIFHSTCTAISSYLAKPFQCSSANTKLKKNVLLGYWIGCVLQETFSEDEQGISRFRTTKTFLSFLKATTVPWSYEDFENSKTNDLLTKTDYTTA